MTLQIYRISNVIPFTKKTGFSSAAITSAPGRRAGAEEHKEKSSGARMRTSSLVVTSPRVLQLLYPMRTWVGNEKQKQQDAGAMVTGGQ